MSRDSMARFYASKRPFPDKCQIRYADRWGGLGSAADRFSVAAVRVNYDRFAPHYFKIAHTDLANRARQGGS